MKITLNIKLGIAAGVINCIAWYAFAKALGYYSQDVYLYKFLVTLFLLIVGIFASIYFERKKEGGLIEFKNALKSGVLFALIFATILSIYSHVYHEVIAVDVIDYFVSEERKAGLALGKPLDEINKTLIEYYIFWL